MLPPQRPNTQPTPRLAGSHSYTGSDRLKVTRPFKNTLGLHRPVCQTSFEGCLGLDTFALAIAPLFLRPVDLFTFPQHLKDASVLLFEGIEVGHYAIGGPGTSKWNKIEHRNDSGMLAKNRSHIREHRSRIAGRGLTSQFYDERFRNSSGALTARL